MQVLNVGALLNQTGGDYEAAMLSLETPVSDAWFDRNIRDYGFAMVVPHWHRLHIYLYICMYVYIYTHTHTYIFPYIGRAAPAPPRGVRQDPQRPRQ